jgi:hypothetical protein
MWFWIGVAVVVVAVAVLLKRRSRRWTPGLRPFYQTRNEFRDSGKVGTFDRKRHDHHRDP